MRSAWKFTVAQDDASYCDQRFNLIQISAQSFLIEVELFTIACAIASPVGFSSP